MAQEIVGVQIQVGGNATEAVGSLRRQLRDAQADVARLSAEFGSTSEQAVAAARRAAELTDTIGDARALVDAFNPDRKFQALGTALQGVAGGFSAVQGAMGLIGIESESVEKTLLKVQSAMALSQGINSILEARDSFKNLKTVAVDAFKGIKAAIGSTGIGLLLVALGTLVAYWDDIKAAVSGVSEEQKKLNADTAKNLEIEKEKLSKLNGQDNILKLQGKTEKQILQLKISQTDQVIKATEEQIKQQKVTLKAQIEAEKRNKEILKGILNFISVPITAVLKAVDYARKALGQESNLEEEFFGGIASFVFDPSEVEKEGEATLKELDKQLGDLKNQRAGFQLSIRNIDKQAADKALADEKSKLEERKKLLEERYQFEKDIQEEIKKLTDNRINYIEGREKQFKDNSERTSALLANRIKDISGKINEQAKISNELFLSQQDKEIDDLAAQFNKRFEIVKGNSVLENALTEQFESQKAAIKKKYADQSLATTANVLGQAATLFGKQTAAGKTVAVAEATINTYLAASKALTGIQKGNPLGSALAIAQAAIIVATGLKSVREIVKTKVPGTSSSISAPSASLSAGSAPINLPTPQAALTQLDQSTINRLGSASNRSYVLESDITNSQERITRINRAARLN